MGTKKRGEDGRSLSLQKYHSNVEEMGKKIEEFAVGLSPDNLLSVKMAMMGAVRRVEKTIKGNREEGEI